MRKPLLLLLAAAIDALLVSATASAQHCNVLRRQPDGVPGQNPITMCLNVSSLPAGGGVIEVTWSGSQDPSPRDVIGLYYSSALPPAPSEPIKYIDAARDPNHLSKGMGKATFAVGNLRWPVSVAMTNRRWGREDVRALSPAVSFESPNEPQQLHVAPAGTGFSSSSPDPFSTAVVQWVTADAKKPRVRYWWNDNNRGGAVGGRRGRGGDGDKNNATVVAAVAEGTTSTYDREHLCGGAARGAGWSSPGNLHRATLRGLPASTRVFYEVFDEEEEEEGKGGKKKKTLRRGGFFFTPKSYNSSSSSSSMSNNNNNKDKQEEEEKEEETRIVLMADAGTADVSPSTQSPGWTFAATRNTSRAVAADLDDGGDGGDSDSSNGRKSLPHPPFRGRLLVHAGDISYANGHGAQWDAFFEQWGTALRRARYAAVVGNHEANWPETTAAAADGEGKRRTAWGRYGGASEDSGGECGVPFFARIASPGWDDEKTTNSSSPPPSPRVTDNLGTFDASPWWSLDEGLVHVLGYSTEHDFARGSRQFAFIENDLKSVDRRRTPWVVVVGHRPMYIDSNFTGAAGAGAAAEPKTKSKSTPPPSTPLPLPPLNTSDVAVSRDLREALEALFLENGVDATFHGHHHSWQRTCGTDGTGQCVFDGENNDGGGGGGGSGGKAQTEPPSTSTPLSKRRNATTHFVIGHGGGDFTDGSLDVPTPPLFQSVEFQHGHARLRANRTAMTIEAVRAADGGVFDSVTLRKKRQQQQQQQQQQQSPAAPAPSASSSSRQQEQEVVATASAKEGGRLLSQRQRRILLRGEVAAAMAAATVLSG